LQNLNLKFRKFLQSQSEFIKEKIKRINNLTGAHSNTLSNKKSHNEFIYTSIPNDEDDILDIDVSLSTQSQMSMTSNRNQYYQDRTGAVQTIEKTMGELASMFSRLGQLVYEQRSMIEKIDNNTDISLNNIELGERELIKIRKDVSSNRGLIIKIFLILIFTSVIYILFFS
jgi:syntaxin 5